MAEAKGPVSTPSHDSELASADSSSSMASAGGDCRDWRRYAALKVSTDYDSEESGLRTNISARLLQGLAKLKASFHRDRSGDIRYPSLSLVSKYLTVLYDHEERNALLTLAADLGSRFRIMYLQDLKAQQGEVKLLAQSVSSKYKAEIAYDLPPAGLPKLSFTFPYGEANVEDEFRDESKVLSLNGFVGGTVLNGQVLASYKDENINLKYKFKDNEVTVAPSISLPSKSPLLSFKRQFNPSNKLSYLYNFDTAAWSAVYKHMANEHFKVKVGYDSDVQLAWAALWLGKEELGAKYAPQKCKLQIMLQVPQDDPRSTILLFRLKKRWDV